MSSSNVKPESALSWGNTDLDRICQSLKDFESLLIVFKEGSLYRWGQEQAREALIPNSQQAGLYLKEVEVLRNNMTQIDDSLLEDNPDAVVLFSSEADRDKLNLLCSKISQHPVAVIAVFQEAPNLWERFFENCIEISKGTAVLKWRDGRNPVKMPFNTNEEEISVGSLKDTIAIVGATVDREKQLKAVLGGSKYKIQKADSAAVIKDGAALVIYEEAWTDDDTESEIQKLAAVSTVFVSNTQSMRAEDRVRCYRAGARLVFSEKSAIEELVAAVNSYLFPKEDRFDPFVQLDQENKKYLARTRREAIWSKADLDKVIHLYKPLVTNHFKRAQLLDAEVIMLLIKIPQAPKEIADTGWQNVFQKALVSTLVSSLRNGDLTLIVDDMLVVVMSAVHSIATKPVLKRMQNHLKQLSAPPVFVDVVIKPFSEDISATDEAEKMLKGVFTNDGSQFRELSKWISEN